MAQRCCCFVTCKYEINKRKFIYWIRCQRLRSDVSAAYVATYLWMLPRMRLRQIQENHVCKMNYFSVEFSCRFVTRLRRTSTAENLCMPRAGDGWSTEDFSCGQILRKLFSSYFHIYFRSGVLSILRINLLGIRQIIS